MMRLIKRLGFKVVTDFYQSIADETLDVNGIIDKYLELQKRENDTHDDIVYRSAEGYNLQAAALPEETTAKEDVLVIDQNLKGLDFKLARCCNPIYGDEVFGFVTVSGGIKIHRCDCPNASDLRERFGYRIVKARWAGKSQGTQVPHYAACGGTRRHRHRYQYHFHHLQRDRHYAAEHRHRFARRIILWNAYHHGRRHRKTGSAHQEAKDGKGSKAGIAQLTG